MVFRHTARDFIPHVEASAVPAGDLFRTIALGAFGAGAPGQYSAAGVDREDG
jgi:hypothetical protein